jgi:hypothetical protein
MMRAARVPVFGRRAISLEILRSLNANGAPRRRPYKQLWLARIRRDRASRAWMRPWSRADALCKMRKGKNAHGLLTTKPF